MCFLACVFACRAIGALLCSWSISLCMSCATCRTRVLQPEATQLLSGLPWVARATKPFRELWVERKLRTSGSAHHVWTMRESVGGASCGCSILIFERFPPPGSLLKISRALFHSA